MYAHILVLASISSGQPEQSVYTSTRGMCPLVTDVSAGLGFTRAKVLQGLSELCDTVRGHSNACDVKHKSAQSCRTVRTNL